MMERMNVRDYAESVLELYEPDAAIPRQLISCIRLLLNKRCAVTPDVECLGGCDGYLDCKRYPFTEANQ